VIEEGVPLSRFTTLGTGGPARWFARPSTVAELEQALAWAGERGAEVAVVGLGSNLLVADEGVDALVLKLTGELAAAAAEGEQVVAGGGAPLAVCLHRARAAGLGGLEFACAIPGTVGGAVKMNAGAYGGEMADVLASARVVDAGGGRDVEPGALDMTYRHTNIGWRQVVSEAVLQLAHADPEDVTATVKRMQGKRSESQPRAARTFGSVFQNPLSPREGGTDAAPGAGALIEQAGLKGHVIGGARISPKHGNFIENVDNATTADVIALVELARATVLEQFGVTLHTEVHLLDHDGYRPLYDERALA
jgi:UDP-N-acetylmuramate dehydrogenase